MSAGAGAGVGGDNTSISTIRVRIGSRREFLDAIHSLSEHVMRRVGFSEDECYWLVTAVREAVSNAVVHGNREEPGTYVVVEFEMSADGIGITVTDEGDGFDPAKLPDPLSEEHLLDASGRGVFLMQQLMDEVSFSFPEEGGTALKMVKSRQSPVTGHTTPVPEDG